MSNHEGVTAELLEALRDAAGVLLDQALGHEPAQGRAEDAFERLHDTCAAALAAASGPDAGTGEDLHRALRALENVKLLAVRRKRGGFRDGDADALLRFCAEAGVVPNPLRESAPASGAAPEPDKCAVCKGSGTDLASDPAHWLPCSSCRGTGKPSEMQRFEQGVRDRTPPAAPEERDDELEALIGDLERLAGPGKTLQWRDVAETMTIGEKLRSLVAQRERAAREAGRAEMGEVSAGVRLIAVERQRQIGAEGWTPAHDDTHKGRELAKAAACYALVDADCPPVPALWPWSVLWWKPSSPIRNLVKAGALIAAEIDRLVRQPDREGV